MLQFEIAKNLYYVGVNDRHKRLFENMLPLPYGVSYNSYLIVDEKIALIDTVETPFAEELCDNIKDTIGDRKVDYLIVNHMEPDHSSGIKSMLLHYPELKLVVNAKTVDMLKGYYALDESIMHIINDGDTLSIGERTLSFHFTPMVHWPEVMMTYIAKDQILFSADAFGCFGTLDGAVLDTQLNLDIYYSEMYRYYANIVGKYGSPVQTALKKLSGLPLSMICSTHGPVWTKHISEVVGIYDALSDNKTADGVVIAYGSMHGHTEQMAEVVAKGVASVTKNVRIYDVSTTDQSLLLGEIFRNKGLILGSPTYCNEMYPNMLSIMNKISTRNIKDRAFGYWGTFTWIGAAYKAFAAFAEKMKWENAIGVEIKQSMTKEQETELFNLGKTIAERVVGINKN
jgi:flavorubredoxin